MKYAGWARTAILPVMILLLSCGGGGGITISLDAGIPGIEKAAGMWLHLVTEDPNVTWTRIQGELAGATQAGLLRAYHDEVESHEIAARTLDKGLAARFTGVAAGRYWVVTLEPVASGSLRMFWAEPAHVEKGVKIPVRLTLSNAALLVDTADCDLN